MYAKLFNSQVTQYPYTWTDFVADNNNTNYGDVFDLLVLFPQSDLARQGYECVEVNTAPAPDYDSKTQKIELDNQPVYVGDKWVVNWSIVQKTAEEIQADLDAQAQAMRGKRKKLLAESDWTQVADSPVDKAVWATYRQALRDVPSQAGFPWEVTWPMEPV